MTCRITDLASCVVQELTDALVRIINLPLQPLLDSIHTLLTQPAAISVFAPLWGVIVYVISIFYGLFFLFVGVNFILSGYNAEQREGAKQWLQNTLLMVFFVQASYYIYMILTEITARLTAGVMSMIGTQFFQLTIDNALNVGLEIVLGMSYVALLTSTVVVLAITYTLVSIGVLFFPLGLFLYFIPPVRDVGRFIISKLLFMMFLPFIAAIILLGASTLATTGSFSMIKIIIAIAAFAIIDLLFVILALLAIIRSVFSLLRSDLAQAFLMFKGYFVAATATNASNKQYPSERERGRYR